jgi:ATP-binding cassette subfamily B protein
MSAHELEEEEKEQRHLDLALWRRVLAHARPYTGPLAGLAVSGVILALADVFMPLVTGRVIDSATTDGRLSELARYSLIYLGLVAVTALLIWYFIVMAGRIATGFAHDIRRSAFGRLQELSFSFFDRRPVGWLMARLTSDSKRLSSVIPWTMLDSVWGSSFIIGISVMMLVLNWRLALLVLVIIPPMALVSIVFQRRLLRSQRAVRRTNSLITASFNEGIVGVRTTKALVREEENLGEFQVLSSTMYQHSVRNSLQAAAYLPIVLTLGSVGVGLALWRGGLDVAGLSIAGIPVGERMTLGTLVAFMQYAALFYIPIQEMAERFTEVQAAQASAERLQGLLDSEPEIRDSPELAAALGRQGLTTGGDGGEERIDEIEFRNVSFAYKEREPVLVDFDLRVSAGETIALVGATGSGKSTIVSLLCRFYEPTRGSITIDGVDYRERSLRWLQSNLGIVLQSPHLFSGSIRENIRYGRLDATDEEVSEAARLVNADQFIDELEEGLDTPAGEGGSRLSTGQKQLVSLARAVLADPQIFVMDEATSSVDTETERLIQQGIETVLTGRISFIIAHRLSTIRSADRILVIDRGRIVEQGDHEELLGLRGEYHRLYTQQFARESQELILEGGT